MSAVKLKFAGFLRGLLRRVDDAGPVAPKTSRPVATPPTAMPLPAAAPAPAAVSAAPTAPSKPDEIQLPVNQILMTLPMDLRAKIVGSNTAGMMISLPVDQVLEQLATGSVKITFGDFRRLAPGVFASLGGECDTKLVTLPLNQILAQLNPALLARRAAQKKQVELSEDITSPFNGDGQGLTISTGKMKTPPAAPRQAPQPAAAIPLSRFAPAADEQVQMPSVAQPPPGFTPRWNLPATNGHTNGHVNGNGHGNGSAKPNNLSAAPVPPATATPTPPMAALPEQSQPTISAPLGELSEHWPEELKREIELLDLAGAQIALPIHLVEPALKRGRVIFSWRFMRSWIKSAAVAASSHDDLELELPLKVLAPLFFSHKNGTAKAQKKSAVSEEIPNLFFGFPQPEAAPAPIPMPAPAPVTPAAPAAVPPTPAMPLPKTAPAVVAASPLPETNFFTRVNQSDTSDSEFKRRGGTDFLSRAATPSEVVFRAMELPGVAGVIVALPDGLKVASQIPSDLNGDTLAAFLPQIFARVNQCSRELRMGDMNNLSFTVGNIPWKIFRVNAVYFAAFGRANENLPSVQLAALAASLDRKKQ